MGRIRTPAYRLEYATVAGRNVSRGTWRVRAEGPIPGHGKPTQANLRRYVDGLVASFEPGGCNEHCGKMQLLAVAIVRQSDSRPVATVLANVGSVSPFVHGWAYGRLARNEPTAREVEEHCPDLEPDEVTEFQNGALDGVHLDTWRLDQQRGG